MEGGRIEAQEGISTRSNEAGDPEITISGGSITTGEDL